MVQSYFYYHLGQWFSDFFFFFHLRPHLWMAIVWIVTYYILTLCSKQVPLYSSSLQTIDLGYFYTFKLSLIHIRDICVEHSRNGWEIL